MKLVKATAIVILVAIGAVVVAASASAQSPSAAPTPTLLNPNWCSDVPASPPPPGFERRAGDWAGARKMCMNLMHDRGCTYICETAEQLWQLQKKGQLNQPNTFPSPTNQPQGPFPLPGGAQGYVLPAQPAPSAPPSDAAGPRGTEDRDSSRGGHA